MANDFLVGLAVRGSGLRLLLTTTGRGLRWSCSRSVYGERRGSAPQRAVFHGLSAKGCTGGVLTAIVFSSFFLRRPADPRIGCESCGHFSTRMWLSSMRVEAVRPQVSQIVFLFSARATEIRSPHHPDEDDRDPTEISGAPEADGERISVCCVGIWWTSRSFSLLQCSGDATNGRGGTTHRQRAIIPTVATAKGSAIFEICGPRYPRQTAHAPRLRHVVDAQAHLLA